MCLCGIYIYIYIYIYRERERERESVCVCVFLMCCLCCRDFFGLCIVQGPILFFSQSPKLDIWISSNAVTSSSHPPEVNG